MGIRSQIANTTTDNDGWFSNGYKGCGNVCISLGNNNRYEGKGAKWG